MNTTFSPNMTQPNRPLRKPTSGPMTTFSAFPPVKFPIVPEVGPAPVAADAIVDDLKSTPHTRDKSKLMELVPPALTVYFCNYCGHQGNFRCKRCKKVPYCSVVCQTEDWRAHRHVCKPIEPTPAKDDLIESIHSPKIGDPLTEVKAHDSSSPRKVYMNDLDFTKTIKGADIQASVIEFYSPGRFFLLAQNPELMEAQQIISTELQKTCSIPLMPYVPCVGEVCAVQFSCDMKWYRGLVKTLAANQKMANILYIDFGNEEDVPMDRIRPLPSNIQTFPPCAMECRIAHVVPVVGSWSDECCMIARQLLAGKTVTVKLVETQDNSHVHAVDILLSGKYLSTFLIEQGYGLKETSNVAPTQKDISAIMNASLENFKCLSDGKDVNTWAQPPDPITQAVGDQLSVLVTFFLSPNELIVQKVENAGVIQDLQLKLREHCSRVAYPQNFRPAPGTVCCAQFSEDMQWYRAKILAYPSEKRVCVGYLDFGNSEEVDLGCLRPISPSLLALPMQAIPCGLAGVQPVGDRWSEDCILALKQRVSNRILRIDIQGPHEGKALVTMIDEASDPQANLAELLISAGYAVPTPPTSVDQQASDGAATTEPLVSHPECEWEPLVWSTAELPCDGQTVSLLVNVVESPGKFFCRTNNPTDHQRLIELGDQLKEHCEADMSPFTAKVGEPCCIMFPGNGLWYRAMVKEISEDKAAVNLVDYGYSLTVEKSKLHSITPKLLRLPFQAVLCWLAGVEPLGSEWSSEALLWFQSLVGGEKLSALVLSVTEQGYGLELESKGQKVAAALIAEKLAKVSGEMSKETDAKSGCVSKQEVEKEHGHKQLLVGANNKMEANSKEMMSEEQTAEPSNDASFPVDWKTVELPLNETFCPYIAAVISPSLFYLFGVTPVDQQKLQEVMIDLAAICDNSPFSAGGKCRPVPGAACCAQFSADNKWYRAVVLEVGETELSVLYVDYGNSEKVPFSRIRPIPVHLLQLPFQITRCTLTGKEHFPSEWPADVLLMFGTELMNGILATVEAFDGSDNVLSLTLPTERGGGHLTAMILDALNTYTTSNPATKTRTDQPDNTPIRSSAEPGLSQPVPESLNDLETMTVMDNTVGPTISPEPSTQKLQQMSSTSAATANEDPVEMVVDQTELPSQNNTNNNDPDHQTSICCCQSIKAKIDNLEQMMQLQIVLIKKFVGENK